MKVDFGLLTAWGKSIGYGRADYVKAFMAITQLQVLLDRVDIYSRLFAYNIYHFGYKSKENLAQYTNIQDQDILEKIHTDPVYGFNGTSGTFKWVQAFNGLSTSKKYQDILTHFSTALPGKFTNDTMSQIVGDKSFLVYINRTYTYKLASEISGGTHLDSAVLLAS